MNKQNKHILIETNQTYGCQREEDGGWGKKVRGNIVNNILVILHGDRRLLHLVR